MSETQFWLPEGTVVGNRYRLESVLGVGGYGITYKGIDIRLDRLVAVKEYYPGFWVSRYADRDPMVHCQGHVLESFDKGLDRFLDEAKTLVALSNIPEVVRVSDFFEENNTAYMVMDFLDGQNLKQMADGFGGRIPANILIPVLEPLVKALGKIHEKGMIHRDLSPDNIMMLEDGTVRLIDFGNSRDTTNNKSMTLAMKQGFAAPEQYKSRGQGTYTDVYGLCATMYYCLTGKLPPQAMERLTGTPFLSPTEHGVDILPVWEQAIMDGLELYVQKRIQTMEELWERLYGQMVEESDREAEGHNTEYLENSCFVQEDTDMSQELQKTQPLYHYAGLTQITEVTDNDMNVSGNKIQSGLDIIREACIRIYRMLKEK